MSTYDEQMLKVTSMALDKIFGAPTPRERERMADFSEKQQRRIIGHWIYKHDDIEGVVLDKLNDIDVHKLIADFESGDEAEIGRVVAKLLMSFKTSVDADEHYWRTA